MFNPIFQTEIKSFGQSRARQRRNRVELLSKDVADELNTYKNFGVFYSFNDVFNHVWKKGEGGEEYADDLDTKVPDAKPGTPGVRSIFNKYSSPLVGTSKKDWANNKMDDIVRELVQKASPFRLTNNTPLLDTPENRRKLREMSGCSVRELVKASHAGYFGVATYSYADFMYCKHLGRISNNYLITLRRFPVPVLDSIAPAGRGRIRKGTGKADIQYPIGTMVTWMGVSGNDMKNLLKYNFKMGFKEYNANWEQVETEGGSGGILNGMEAALNPATRKSFNTGTSNPALSGMLGSMFGGQQDGPYTYRDGHDATATKNKVYGPIDRVKTAYGRSEEGLTFDHKMTITFEYELKAYNGINPRQAMLDLLASILSVTYTTGGFWKGGYHGGGQRQSSAFANLNIFKCNGGFTDFMDALAQDLDNGKQALAKKYNVDLTDPSSWAKLAGQVLNNIGGMLIGGLLNKLGRPKKYFAPSLISDAPAGLWHVTIGNPHHPIMSVGNLILTGTEISHSGPLGLDDFPTNLTVVCQFDRGKPRDQFFIEQMYMSGNDRIYHTMSGKVSDMYRVAKTYKNKPETIVGTIVQNHSASDNTTSSEASGSGGNPTNSPTALGADAQKFNKNTKASMGDADVQDYIRYYFGKRGSSALVTSATEQGYGSTPAVKPAEPEAQKSTDGEGDKKPEDTTTDKDKDKNKK